jgi:hypothetical protein
VCAAERYVKKCCNLKVGEKISKGARRQGKGKGERIPEGEGARAKVQDKMPQRGWKIEDTKATV